MPALLDRELETFELHREELLGSAEGKFVLIHGSEIAGIFESKPDAIAQGYQKYGNAPFLVRQVLKIETPQNFVSNLLGV